jgi:large subunit ribosomal protein L28
MANVCERCGKHTKAGRTITHSHKVNRRTLYPNLQTLRVDVNGVKKKVKICTRCYKKIVDPASVKDLV